MSLIWSLKKLICKFLKLIALPVTFLFQKCEIITILLIAIFPSQMMTVTFKMNITDSQNSKKSVTHCTLRESLMTINQSNEKKCVVCKKLL